MKVNLFLETLILKCLDLKIKIRKRLLFKNRYILKHYGHIVSKDQIKKISKKTKKDIILDSMTSYLLPKQYDNDGFHLYIRSEWKLKEAINKRI